MSNFEFVFSLFSILLGLALAQVFGGLARAVEARRKVRIGAPTLLLSALIVADLTLFWRIVWRARDAMPDTSVALFTALIVSGLYYFAAVLVIPADVAERTELDSHFTAEKNKVIGCIVLANAIAYGARFALMGWQSFVVIEWTGWIEVATLIVAGIAALFVSNRRALIALLAIMLASDLVDPVFTLLGVGA